MQEYSEETIQSLDWKEHIRRRPGMYIGKLGDGAYADDGIYVLLKEVMDNSIDEYMMGFGKKIEITLRDGSVTVRDYGRGIPLGKVVEVVSKMNTGAKYDSKVFKKSVGLNGVGTKAVNALSINFTVQAFREGVTKKAVFSKGELINDLPEEPTVEHNGTLIRFTPDYTIFENYAFRDEFIENLLKNYTYLNPGLTIKFNDTIIRSEKGLIDLLDDKMTEPSIYPYIHLKDTDFEIVFTHTSQYGEEYYTFVNGQHTTQGGTHLVAFREAFVKTVREYFNKNFDVADIRQGIAAAVSIKIEDPVFESQTKTRLGSKDMEPDGVSIRNYVGDFLKQNLDNFLHKHLDIADIIQKKILESEKERKAISGIQKLAKERAKKVSLHNKKLRDCRIHYNSNDERKLESSIFITEGDSASGSITKARDVACQAVFSLRGKPLNTHGLTRKVVYENEEFNLLQAALNIEEGLETLRYNHVIIATDADVDGMHIRLLLITFFLQFFPELVKNGHLYILQTPLFRVRNKKKSAYCYSEDERLRAIKELGPNPEITRFKGLGEISPDEFKGFIDKNIRLERVRMKKEDAAKELLDFYMGKNTPVRQNFIIDNLVVDEEML
ncbi:MAG: type IIA DNA topoisomerase subunit B [Bacteroidales bacterium]|nr:type IIA DNA topoisomerase subunit B [Bacteroidales bacterium]